jgi:hypothetical protein
MAWIFFQASAVCPWAYKDMSEQSHIVKVIPIAKLFSYQECEKEYWHVRPYGMISATSQFMKSHQLTLFSGDFLAKTSALREMVKAWMESEADYFSRSSGLQTHLNQNSSFWKMYLPLYPEEEQKWLGQLPPWGMTAGGALYQLAALEQYTKGSDGSCLPTPTASDWKRSSDSPADRKRNNPHLQTKLNMLAGTKSLKINLSWLEWMMGFPIGWTELGLLEMQSYHVRPKRHLKF